MATKNTKIETVTIDQLPLYDGQMGVSDENDFLPVYDVIDGENVNKTGGTRRLPVKNLKNLMVTMRAEYLKKIAKTSFESLTGFRSDAPEPPVPNEPETSETEEITPKRAATENSADDKDETTIPEPDLANILNAACNYIKNNLYDIPGILAGEQGAIDLLNEKFAEALQKNAADSIVYLDDFLFGFLNTLLTDNLLDEARIIEDTAQFPYTDMKYKGTFYMEDKGEASLPKGGLDLTDRMVQNYDSSNGWSRKKLAYLPGSGSSMDTSKYAYPIAQSPYRTLQGIELPYGGVIDPGENTKDHVKYIKETPSYGIYQDARTWVSDPQHPVMSDVLKFTGIRQANPVSTEYALLYTDANGTEEVTINPTAGIAYFKDSSLTKDRLSLHRIDRLFPAGPASSVLLQDLDPKTAVSPVTVKKCEYFAPDKKYIATLSENPINIYINSSLGDGGVLEQAAQAGATVEEQAASSWNISEVNYKYTRDASVFWSDVDTLTSAPFLSDWTCTSWSPNDSHTESFYISGGGTVQEPGYVVTGSYNLYEIKKTLNAQTWSVSYKLQESAPEVQAETVATYSTDGYYPDSGNSAAPDVNSGLSTVADVRRFKWNGWYLGKDWDGSGISCKAANSQNTIWLGEVVHYNNYTCPTSWPRCLALPNTYPEPVTRTLIEQIIAERRVVATPEDMKQLRVVTYKYDLESGDEISVDKEFWYSFVESLDPKECCYGLWDMISTFIQKNLREE